MCLELGLRNQYIGSEKRRFTLKFLNTQQYNGWLTLAVAIMPGKCVYLKIIKETFLKELNQVCEVKYAFKWKPSIPSTYFFGENKVVVNARVR